MQYMQYMLHHTLHHTRKAWPRLVPEQRLCSCRCLRLTPGPLHFLLPLGWLLLLPPLPLLRPPLLRAPLQAAGRSAESRLQGSAGSWQQGCLSLQLPDAFS